jgi:hypothetical protein
MLVLVLSGFASVAAAADRAPQRDLSAYEGLGTWLDIYDRATWRDPQTAVTAMAQYGVTTLYLETSNSRQPTDLVRPAQLARLLDTAHAAGLRVVAWYLPTLVYPARDIRRVFAAVRFRTPTGGRFDSFALDIEASDVRSVPLRNRRLASLSASLRAAAGSSYPLGAIVPSAVGMELHPKYWPGFPYSMLRESFDVFLPMAYYTYRVKGRVPSARYVMRSIALLRAGAGADVPVHVIGGIANRTGPSEAAGFMDAVSRCGPIGYSLYDFPITSSSTWAALASLPPAPAGPAACTVPPVS